ncbi:5'/3'-nucleotidase SurE [compost metagenome]
MNVLLTNGGGYDAKGLVAMRLALIASGFNVLTVAPTHYSEFVAQSVSHHGSLTFERAGGDEKHPIYRVDGTPVDCVRVAILSGLAREVSVVIAGVAEGACLGDQAAYSSTVGAAVEAALLGYPSLAIAQEAVEEESDLNWSCVVGGELAAWLGAATPIRHCALNVNVPAVLKSRRLKLCEPAHRIWSPAELGDPTIDELGRVIFSSAFNQRPFFDMAANTDAAAVASGHVSITTLAVERGFTEKDNETHAWLQNTIQIANGRIGATPQPCESGCCS